MRTALIGYTGFVGSNIADQFLFDDLYNSNNIHSIENQEYDLIICAGVRAVKWWANQNPEQDKREIQSLMFSLEKVRAKEFVLISSIDVYDQTQNVDENTIPDIHKNHPYGAHRRELEIFIENTFQKTHIVRLPGLFGKGLKKNILFDLLNKNQIEKIIPNSIFQYYPLARIMKDIQQVLNHNISLVNLVGEPIDTLEIQKKFFSSATIGSPVDNPIRYDIGTIYGTIFGGDAKYSISKTSIIKELEIFIQTYN